MPKCGSSALQTYLSRPEFSEACAGRCLYAAVRGNGTVLWGEKLAANAAASPFSYCSSHPGKVISSFSARERETVRSVLLEFAKRCDTLIFSNEGWGARAGHFADDCLFAGAGFEVSVLAYVRPQVEWMNSAWWQWGAWAEAPLGRWVKNSRPNARWHDILQQWTAKPWVKQVQARLLDGDIVQDFMHYLGYEAPPQPHANRSLPGTVLRLFQRHRQLRPGPHDSAIEFVLARHLELDNQKNPWVLRPALVEQLLAFYRRDNEQLAHFLPADQSRKMLDDPRWWQPASYSQRPLAKPAVERLNAEELERLAVSALAAINRLDAEVRQLKSSTAGNNSACRSIRDDS
jgi:hypothetical protein